MLLLLACLEEEDGGIVWPPTVEGQVARQSCGIASSKFKYAIDDIFLIFYFYIYPSLSLSFSSQVVFARRYCLDVIGWGPVVFSGCTLVSDNTTSFQVITLRLSNASNVSAAQEREAQIASEVSQSFACCIK